MGIATKPVKPVSIVAEYSVAAALPATLIAKTGLPAASNEPAIVRMRAPACLESCGRAYLDQIEYSIWRGRFGGIQSLLGKIAQVSALAGQFYCSKTPPVEPLEFGPVLPVIDFLSFGRDLARVGLVKH